MREYSIDLVTAKLSWRKFSALLSGLSGDSVFYNYMRNKPVYIEDGLSVIASMQASFGIKKK